MGCHTKTLRSEKIIPNEETLHFLSEESIQALFLTKGENTRRNEERMTQGCQSANQFQTAVRLISYK
jgi:hypothetical protein